MRLLFLFFTSKKIRKFSLSRKFVDTQFFLNRLKNPRHRFLCSLWWRFHLPQISSPDDFFYCFSFFGEYFQSPISQKLKKIKKKFSGKMFIFFNVEYHILISESKSKIFFPWIQTRMSPHQPTGGNKISFI